MYSNLNILKADDYEQLQFFSDMRTITNCEGQFINQLIWSDYLNTKYYKDKNYIFYVMNDGKEAFSMMPLCKTEYIAEAFKAMEDFFNDTLNLKLKLFSIDEFCLKEFNKIPYFEKNYIIEENRNYFDYIYDAEKLKTLSGKKYHKKKNHLNSFLKEYSGRYRYENLTDKNISDIKSFLDIWYNSKENSDEENRLYFEKKGIFKVIENYNSLKAELGGVYIDNKLEAFSIGSLNKNLNRAVIHIEKANPQIRGLYNFINQQFIINAFNNVSSVNREDDLGIDGLRQAKLSYNPIDFSKKYSIIQKE